MRCPNCGEENIFGAVECTKCGHKLTIVCPYCGEENILGIWACAKCGKLIRSAKRPTEEKE